MMSRVVISVLLVILLQKVVKNYGTDFTPPPIADYIGYSDEVPEDYLLAMVAIHECINTKPRDALYIMGATWNRVLVNHGGYGTTVRDQILSPEYKGLIDKNFRFDSNNPRHLKCLRIAREIMRSDILVFQGILGWYAPYSTDTAFIKKVKSRLVDVDTYHFFWN